MEEYFDTFTIDGKPMGIKPKSFCHSASPNVYHKPVWIWIYNDAGQILVQKRSANKKNFPGLFDMPSAGHVHAGEKLIDACVRETFEELGVKVKGEEFHFEGEILKQEAWELAQVYTLKLNVEEGDFKIALDEVELVKWLDFDEFLKLFNSDKFVSYQQEYKNFVYNILKDKIKMEKQGKIYLTSGGYIDGQRGEKLDKIIENCVSGKKVLIVDNATTTGSNLKGRENVIENFNLNNLSKLVDVLTLKADNLKAIHDYDAIYMLGGDVTPFIEIANSSSAAEELRAFVKNGGVIFGESAGSMIFGKNLKWIYDLKRGTKNKWNAVLESYNGFGFADINIFPHWNKVEAELKVKAAEYEKQNNIVITRLNDGEYIELDAKNI